MTDQARVVVAYDFYYIIGDARRALTATLAHATERTAAQAGRLAALSPLATLERGYAIVTASDGAAVRRSASTVGR